MAKNYFSYLFLFLCIFLSAKINAQQTETITTSTNSENSAIPPPIYYDFGDAPNSYLTYRDSGGPIHTRFNGMPEVNIGQTVDYENYASPSNGADGDDLNNSQDEDAVDPSDLEGISITTDNFSIDMDYANSSTINANLYAWIDFDGSGSFDADEFTSVLDLKPGEGVATLTWSNLIANGVDIIEGNSYARFRITLESLTSADFGGDVVTGEVEDHSLIIKGESVLGVDDEILAEGLSLYPNPVSNALLVESKVKLKKIEIYSILGQRVKEVNSDFNSISTDNLSRGIYMIKIYSEKGTTVRKLIKI